MSKIMPKSTKEEKFRWIKPILDKEISIKDMALVCPFSIRSLKYWLANYKQDGMDGLENKSTCPKSQPFETPIRIKEMIIDLRRQNRLCAQKLKWKLQKEDIFIHERTIGKIIKKEGLTRRYRTKKIKLHYIKTQLTQGEIIEIDIKYVPKTLKDKQYYQFTAIDVASKWRYLKIYDNMGNSEAIDFVQDLIKRVHFRIRAIKTDNGSCFTNRYTGYLKSADIYNPKLHAFDLLCQRLNIIHYLIDPGKPNQNGCIERSHRTDQESFYDQVNFNSIKMLRYKIKLWNMYYNNLEHCALNGLTPNQVLGIR